MRTGCGDLEHVWNLTLNHIVERRGAPNFFLATGNDRYYELFRRPHVCSSQEDRQWTYRVIKKSLCTWRLQYNHQVYRDFLITLYNVTLRRVRTTIVAVEKQWVLHTLSVYICSFMYLACNAYAPYCHLWPVSLYNIFSTLSYKRHDFRGIKKKLLNIKCVFWFSIQLLSEIFLILRRNEQGMIKKMYFGVHVKYPLFLSDFNETWICATDFRKILKYQISWKSVQWEPSCSMRTDGQTWRS